MFLGIIRLIAQRAVCIHEHDMIRRHVYVMHPVFVNDCDYTYVYISWGSVVFGYIELCNTYWYSSCVFDFVAVKLVKGEQ